jgi:hypothetical protein
VQRLAGVHIRARRLHGHEVHTADEISALSPAESFKDARILKLLGCGRPRRPEAQWSREQLGSAECPDPSPLTIPTRLVKNS